MQRLALVLALGALCAGSVSGQVPQHPEAPPVPLAPQSPLLLDLARKGVEEALARLDASAADALLRQWPAPAVDIHKHYAYAAQWWAMSALITGLYVWYQLIRPRLDRHAR